MPLEISLLVLHLSLASRITAQSLPDAFISTLAPDFLASIVSSNTIIPSTYPDPLQTAEISTITIAPVSVPLTTISGSNKTRTETTTVTATLTAVQPEVTFQPCNGYVEFCNRRFSNVTMVVAHNSPNVVPHNAASNQAVGVQAQLNDGIRGRNSKPHHNPSTNTIAHLRIRVTKLMLTDYSTLRHSLLRINNAAMPYLLQPSRRRTP